MSERICVLVADDHPVYRDGLVRILLDAPDIEVVGISADGTDALVQLRRLEPHVALVDLQLPGLDGVELVEAMLRSGLSTRAVIISAFEESATVYRAFSAGARAYLVKVVTADEIRRTVRAVAAGETVIPNGVQSAFAEEFRRRTSVEGDAPLTARELDVLRLAAEGKPSKEIAAELFVGLTTVKTHLRHVYEKFGVGDRAAAVAEAMRRGLLR